MRTERDELDPKSRPGAERAFKGEGAREAAEAEPWREVRPGKRSADHDRHVHL